MIVQPADRLSQVGEYYFARKLREIRAMSTSGLPVINLGIGSPDLPPHPSVIDTLRTSAGEPGHHGYQPYKGIPALREAMASWYHSTYRVEVGAHAQVLPLIGSKEGIFYLSMAFLNPGDQALVPNPGYPGYAAATRLAQGIPVLYDLREENGWMPDPDQLRTLYNDRVRILWINYPHMPTGAVATATQLKELVTFAQEYNVLLCHDNPYSLVLNAARPLSLLALPGAWECGVELNSLSKAYNMAGWRVGMLIARNEVVETVERVKTNVDSGMFLPIQEAAVTALRLEPAWREELNAIYGGRKAQLLRLFERIGCMCHDGAGLFVWARIPGRWESAEALSEALLHEARVFIAPGMIFGSNGERYLRASLCVDESTIETCIQRVSAAQNVLL